MEPAFSKKSAVVYSLHTGHIELAHVDRYYYEVVTMMDGTMPEQPPFHIHCHIIYVCLVILFKFLCGSIIDYISFYLMLTFELKHTSERIVSAMVCFTVVLTEYLYA